MKHVQSSSDRWQPKREVLSSARTFKGHPISINARGCRAKSQSVVFCTFVIQIVVRFVMYVPVSATTTYVHET